MSEEVLTSQPAPIDALVSAKVSPNEVPTGAGLGCLKSLDELVVKQRQDHREINTYAYKNTFLVYDNKGLKLFNCKEESNCCMRNYCGTWRPFDMTVKQEFGFMALNFYRPTRCDSCCFPCCLQELRVYGSDSYELGAVVQKWHPFARSFQVQNAHGEKVLIIKGNCIQFATCQDLLYTIYSNNGDAIGKICKPRTDLLQDAFADPYLFKIHFPPEMETNTKALLLGAYFLIDYIYHEEDCLSACCLRSVA